jgi:hypothetical protein
MEMKEMFKALGYVGGEIHEITKDGIGWEDVKSIKDIIENKDMLLEGFKVEGDFKEHLKSLYSYDQLIEIVVAAKEGYDLGKK